MLDQYITFFTASATAAATLVGLFFVVLAIDVDLDKEFRIKQYMVSETAFISLGGIFIISMLALLPSGVILMAVSSIILSVAGIWILLSRTLRFASEPYLPRDAWFIFLTVAAYALLAGTSVWMLVTGATTILLDIFCALFSILYILSLIRAWRTLLITRRHGSK